MLINPYGAKLTLEEEERDENKLEDKGWPVRLVLKPADKSTEAVLF